MIRSTNQQQDSRQGLEAFSLLMLDGCRKGQAISIPSTADFVVGRSRRCDLRVMNASVSRLHCRLRLSEYGELCVHDMNSLTGTFVNDRRVVGPTTLNDGDVLRIGSIKARVMVGAPIESDSYSFEPPSGNRSVGARGSSLKATTHGMKGNPQIV